MHQTSGTCAGMCACDFKHQVNKTPVTSPCYHNQSHLHCIFSFYTEGQKALLGLGDEVVSLCERNVLPCFAVES